MTLLAEKENRAVTLPRSILAVLERRGYRTPEAIQRFLQPSLSHLSSPGQFAHMKTAVTQLRRAVENQEAIAIYADRDVDGLSGLAILARSLRALGGRVVWGGPHKKRGVEQAVVQTLLAHQPKVFIFVDCGSNEGTVLQDIAAQGIHVIVADHHRLPRELTSAVSWIHPEHQEGGSDEIPAGCVMAFKLAQALWLSFLGHDDPERLDYFLFDHLDLVSLGILADRMPLVGENRIFVWHGLRRLAGTRKTGLAALLRFFRLARDGAPLDVRPATWQLIPLLNAGGRLGRPELTADLLITEDLETARTCIDALLKLNKERRLAQDLSLAAFEKAIAEQCDVERDPILLAVAEGLEPSVTGLAAQAFVREYARPVFLFVKQGTEVVGSGRGHEDGDLFAWIDSARHLLLRYGGHEGAVGMTVALDQLAHLKSHLWKQAETLAIPDSSQGLQAEASVPLAEIDQNWWQALERLAPFGQGNPIPVFELTGIEQVEVVTPRRIKTKTLILRSGSGTISAEVEADVAQSWMKDVPRNLLGSPILGKKTEQPFPWILYSSQRGLTE